jgi:saccharopine dehydrogenase-like NADP-dependent oxidoreductase
MGQKILILGGVGQVGQSVAKDLLCFHSGQITLTGRNNFYDLQLLTHPAIDFLRLDLADFEALSQAIATHDLIIHCAGAFHHRDGSVLKACIAAQKDYIDVSDHRCLYEKIKSLKPQVATAGITAICNAGVFPGISNSMVRLGVEQLDQPEQIELYYGVAGSGGAGQTVMTTTFLGLTQPFTVWQGGQWVKKQPYSEPQQIQFAEPIGRANVYWFDVAETFTFAESFPVQTVITKFGSVPDMYNHLTRAMTLLPFGLLKNRRVINALSKISYGMTQVSDRLTGVGVAMRAIITGTKDGQPMQVQVNFVHDHTAIAAGQGVGMVAELLLTQQITQKGLYPIEQVIPSNLFLDMAKKRNLTINLTRQSPVQEFTPKI